MRVLVDKLVKPSRAFLSSPPRCSQCFLMASSVNSHSRGLVSCLFGSAALYPVAQKPRDGPINGRATYPVIQRTNNVCSHQSAGMEGAQRPCVLYQCFNGEMWERPDGAVCFVLVFAMWDLKGPDEPLHSCPLTSWQVTQRKNSLSTSHILEHVSYSGRRDRYRGRPVCLTSAPSFALVPRVT